MSRPESLYKRVELAKQYLQEAISSIDGISKDNKDPETDKILHEATDFMYEAQEALEKVSDSRSTYVSEHVVIRDVTKHRRPRIKK